MLGLLLLIMRCDKQTGNFTGFLRFFFGCVLPLKPDKSAGPMFQGFRGGETLIAAASGTRGAAPAALCRF
jgi:hypothetical protein